MAKVQPVKRKQAKKGFVPEAELPQRTNYLIILAGLLVIIIGYIVMQIGDATSPLALTYAPIILVIGYCVIIPIGIIHRRRKNANAAS